MCEDVKKAEIKSRHPALVPHQPTEEKQSPAKVGIELAEVLLKP